MTTEILRLIDRKLYKEAYNLTLAQTNLPRIYEVWPQIMDGQTYGSIDRAINFDIFDVEIIETVNLYIHLSNSELEDDLLSEFRRVAKMIIAETAARLRPHTTIDGAVRIAIQELIDHFDAKELYESKADMSRVKAQLTLTMNMEKRFIGEDMVQYGRNYEAVNQYADCIQIYGAIIRDFESALDEGYNDKAEQALELSFLKEAYEGIVRLTDNAEAKAKATAAAAKMKALQPVL